MDTTGANWWMDANNRWHRGRPPAGWWQTEDRRWHPPAVHEPVGDVPEGPPVGPAHLASRSPTAATGREWPRWALSAALALVVIAAVMAIVAAAVIDSS